MVYIKSHQTDIQNSKNTKLSLWKQLSSNQAYFSNMLKDLDSGQNALTGDIQLLYTNT